MQSKKQVLHKIMGLCSDLIEWLEFQNCCSHLSTQLFLLSSLGCKGNAAVVKPCGDMENSGSEFSKHIFFCILAKSRQIVFPILSMLDALYKRNFFFSYNVLHFRFNLKLGWYSSSATYLLEQSCRDSLEFLLWLDSRFAMLAVPLRNKLREGNFVNLHRRNFILGSYSGSNMYVLAAIDTKNIWAHCKVFQN